MHGLGGTRETWRALIPALARTFTVIALDLPGHCDSDQEGAGRGGYVLAEADGELQVILIGTGSEVQIALDARTQLQAAGVGTRVVSVPCVEWFAVQDPAYRDQVLPPAIAARVSVEAGVATGWERIVGDAGRTVSVEHFGASADAATLYRELGITADAVAAAARDSLSDARNGAPPGGHPASFAPAAGGTADQPH